MAGKQLKIDFIFNRQCILTMKKKIKKIIAFVYYHLFKKHQNNIGNTILLYHSIGTNLDFDTYGISIPKEKFLEHILYLKDNYEIILVDNSYKNNLDRKTISITFDDGYEDNLYALEICKKFNIPFTLYITTGFIGKENYLSEEDIKKFADYELCTLGTHSVSHPHLDTLSYELQYKELKESKEVLENIIGKEITQMSYPHGLYNLDTIKLTEKLGYNLVSSSHIGLNSASSFDPRRLKRIEIVSNDSLMELEKKILGYYDYLKFKECF